MNIPRRAIYRGGNSGLVADEVVLLLTDRGRSRGNGGLLPSEFALCFSSLFLKNSLYSSFLSLAFCI